MTTPCEGEEREELLFVPLAEILTELESGSRPRGGVSGIRSGIPSVGGEHLNGEGGFEWSGIKYVPHAFYTSMRRGHVRLNDILIVKDGATTGKTSFVDDTFPFDQAVVNEHVFRLRVNENRCVPEYLYWFLRGRDGQLMLADALRGSAQGGINLGFVNHVTVPLPENVAEQSRIVELIRSAFSEAREARERVAQIPKKVKALKASILLAAFRGDLTADWRAEHPDTDPADKLLERILAERRARWEEAELAKVIAKGKWPQDDKWKAKYQEPTAPDSEDLDELPDGWCWATIGMVTECLDRYRVPVNRQARLTRGGTIPYYGANGQVGFIDRALFDEQLVLVVEDETFVGREEPFSYMIEGPSWVNNHAHVLRPVDPISPRFLNYSLAYYPFTALTSGTTGRRKLTQEAMMQARYPLPPLIEQEEIVARVGAAYAEADVMASAAESTLTTLKMLKQSILSAAFSGEI